MKSKGEAELISGNKGLESGWKFLSKFVLLQSLVILNYYSSTFFGNWLIRLHVVVVVVFVVSTIIAGRDVTSKKREDEFA